MSKIHFGVVEDRNDPNRLGRCKVRVVDMHTHDKTVLPTEDLPWALVCQPLDGSSIVAPPLGTQVTVVYIDEPYCQIPLVLGKVPSIPQDELTFIDRFPNYPKVVENITDYIPQELSKNAEDQSKKENQYIMPTDAKEESSQKGENSLAGAVQGQSVSQQVASFTGAITAESYKEKYFQTQAVAEQLAKNGFTGNLENYDIADTLSSLGNLIDSDNLFDAQKILNNYILN